MKFIFGLALIMCSSFVFGATRDFIVDFTMDCVAENGDDLDIDNDGICEQLDGFRIYESGTGAFVTGIPEDGTRSISFRHNAPWGDQCFYMSATIIDPTDGSTIESEMSNTGGCLVVRPGKPVSPNVTN